MNKTKTAMILAAGFGKRLYPITRDIPKPLVPIANRPLMENIIINLADACIERIAINTHYLPDKIETFIKNSNFSCEFEMFHEEEILGTGGGISNARNFLQQEDFFILHNCDILNNLDINDLITFHAGHGGLVTMVLTDYGPKNMVSVSPDGCVRDIRNILGTHEENQLTYAGIAAISKEFFRYLPKEGYFDLIKGILQAIRENPKSVRAFIPEDFYWNDIGTIRKYLDAHRDVLIEEAIKLKDLNLHNVLWCFFDTHPLKNCVILEGATKPLGKSFENTVIGADFTITDQQREIVLSNTVQASEFSYKAEAHLLQEQGSDRSFWRITETGKTAVLMKCQKVDDDFNRFIRIGEFLNENNFGAPEIISCRSDEKSILMEDLGDALIYNLVNDDDLGLRELYKKIIDFLVDFQVRGTALLPQCKLAGDRIFDYDTLRWETNYFRECFLENFSGLPIENGDLLDREFHRLAQATLEQPVVLMHRDFQSQNILMKNGDVRIVDFQGARRGPICYDLMSLLRDSYVDLGDKLREKLLEYYYEKINRQQQYFSSFEQFRFMCTIAGLQRNMQALGAFGFLSLVKGKDQFKKYIPLGLQHLSDGLWELHQFSDRFEPLEYLEELLEKIASKE